MSVPEIVSAEQMAQIEKIMLQRIGKDLTQFKKPFLGRRISSRMRAVGVKDGSEYAKILESDENEPALLFKSFSINVTEFFRDPFVWKCVSNLLPRLLNKNSTINAWSAGSASGEEPYSIAIMLKEAIGIMKNQFKVLATDISLEAINRAKKGQYTSSNLMNLPTEIITKYFTKIGTDTFQLNEEIRQYVVFEQADIASFAADKIHLIFCRNVLIYYEKAAQEIIFKRFHKSLTDDGYLVIGQDETMMGIQSSKLFSCIYPKERIYEKIGQ